MYVDPNICSLADARPGESLEVRRILFERTRQRCADSGIEHHIAAFIEVDLLSEADGVTFGTHSSVLDPRSRE